VHSTLPHRMRSLGLASAVRCCRQSARASALYLVCRRRWAVLSSSERARERALSRVSSSVVLLSSERARERSLSRVSSALVLLPSRRARERAQ
jgi:hypothetical protein